ncbi:UPF0688 protein C1orf174 homolog [Oxyura jamaicensis]|uniref:UPF0688 protein C1orf174 homolog n=1 Tax=Oxyura jamaicensis TaxID=8884 RepID=UPI0015A6378D|nr:UPF0688 protein C1orf174 homolog [Oxyura jamaicensis]
MAAGGPGRRAGVGASRGAGSGRSRQSSSRKAADRQPSKRLKCEKNSLLKSELEGACGTGNLAVRKAALKTSAENSHSEDSGDHNIIQQKKGESIPETSEERQENEHDVSLKPFAEKSGSAPSKTESNENLQNHVSSEEESGSETVLSDESSLKDGGVPETPTELDNSAFLDEDSNQPMPVDRFFGNIDFIQDQPAVALPSTTMSRREFRRLHFIAKEDEEEEEDVL